MMKKVFTFCEAAAAAAFIATLFLAASCSKQPNLAGTAVHFSASAGDGSTRTSYVDGGDDSHQWISWDNEDGIKIFMTETGGTSMTRTYTVASSEREINGSNHVSRAVLSPVSSDHISWGTGTHSFYGVYPSTVADFTATSMSLTIPGPNVTPKPFNSDTKEYPADLTSAFMVAKTTGVSPSSESVNLLFNPLFNAFQFTFRNLGSTSVTVTSVDLASENLALWGNYTHKWGIATDQVPMAFLSNQTMTMTFPDGGHIFAVGASATFTFIVLSQTYNDLSITVHFSGGTSKTLALKKGGSFIEFAERKLHVITPIALPQVAFIAEGSDIVFQD